MSSCTPPLLSAALLVSGLTAPCCSSPGAGGFPIDVDSGTAPGPASHVLPLLRSVYGEWFEVEPQGFRVELVTDPAHWPEYDHFDQDRNRVRMGWDLDAEDESTLTLAHELVHAYEWALDPVAYEQEPSWIHEGLAEYCVWLYLRSVDAAQADAYLRQAARDYLEEGHPFRELFADAYAHPYTEVYPACHLAVHVLAARVTGRAALLEYFRTHGAGRPAKALYDAFEIRPAQLEREVDELARYWVPLPDHIY